MANVTFGMLTAAQLAARKTGATLVDGRVYIVTNGTLISIVLGTGTTTYSILFQDSIASKPTIGANGRSLSYTDATGTAQSIDLSGITIGDNTAPTTGISLAVTGTIQNGDTVAVALSKLYNTLYTYASQGLLFSSGIGDEYDGTSSLVFADTAHIDMTSGTLIDVKTGASIKIADAPTLATHAANKAYVDTMLPLAGGTLTGFLTTHANPTSALHVANKQYVDTFLSKAGGTMTGAIVLSADPAAAMQPATKQYVDSKLAGLFSMKGTLGTAGTVTAVPVAGVAIGDAYRVITAATWAGVVCEVGDILIATAATPTWTVIQTNIDLAGIVATIGVGLAETGGAGGKTVYLPTITRTNNTSVASPAFGATVTMIDNITQDTYGRVTAINTKTVTLPSETAVSATANASTTYKILTNLTSAGHALTTTYADILTMLMTGWATDANVGAIVVGDSIKGALNRLQNRIVVTESSVVWNVG